MLFERSRRYDKAPLLNWEGQLQREAAKKDAATGSQQQDPPLVCMIYFFASQMSRHLQQAEATAAATLSSKAGVEHPAQPRHRLDILLSKIGVHAAFSPHVTRFEVFPVEIPSTGGNRRRREPEPSKESMHDTMLLVNFRNRRAWEGWIATREWAEFMDKTEREGVFRRMPHVRCANSLRGLRDPMEVLRA